MDYECRIECSNAQITHRKHINKKTFVAGDRFKWSRYSNDHTRHEYGWPSYDEYQRVLLYRELFGTQQLYGKTYRKYTGEPPRFNLNLLLKQKQESEIDQGISLPKWLLRSKNSFV